MVIELCENLGVAAKETLYEMPDFQIATVIRILNSKVQKV